MSAVNFAVKSAYLLSAFINGALSSSSRSIVFPDSAWNFFLMRFSKFSKHEFLFVDLDADLDLSKCNYDFFIPLSAADHHFTYGFLDYTNPKVIVPPKDLFRLLNKKDEFTVFLESTKWRQYLPIANDPFPLILKPNIGANSEGCLLIKDEAEYLKIEDKYKSDF